MICWNNPDVVFLDKAIISTLDYNNSNCNHHIESKHTIDELPAEFKKDESKSLPGSVCSKKQVNKITNYGTENPIKASPTIALHLMYSFFNEANIAIKQANSQHLKEYTNYILDNAKDLSKKRGELYFSPYKYKLMESSCFSWLLTDLKYLVNYSRSYYRDNCRMQQPFINVSHDGWDSKDYDILGVSIHFVVPVYWRVLNIAVGLKRIQSKKSANIVEATRLILKR
jgi:hypothetical protein